MVNNSGVSSDSVYQLGSDDPGSEAAPQLGEAEGEGGHIVVVRDDGTETGQPRKIVCYIHGDLPTNVTNDVNLLQEIIRQDKCC